MLKKKGGERLLSIGNFSRITGTGIKALRYYERIHILKPVHVEHDSRYRFYTLDQAYAVMLIQLAVELKFPLKQLQNFLDEQGNMDIQAFAKQGKEMVSAKMRTLKKALRFFSVYDEELALQHQYAPGEIFSRNNHEKYYYVKPYPKPFTEGDDYEITKLLLDFPKFEDSQMEWLDWGVLSYHTPAGITRFVFAELPPTWTETEPNRMKIPAGTYLCRQGTKRQIEDVPAIFADYLKGADTFLAIEVEVLQGKINIHSPMNEVRIMRI